jgi:hypothetical protein
MRRVLLGSNNPEWLDARSLDLLRSAREKAHEVSLESIDLFDTGNGVQWFPWVGTRTMRTLRLWAATRGLEASTNLLSLSMNDIELGEFVEHLAHFTREGADPLRIAATMPNKEREKFDPYVPATLLDKANAAERLDVASARRAAQLAFRQAQPHLLPENERTSNVCPN